jgi:omega-6 fatty acid desaturase (delta-12 desaturase)
LPLVVAAGLAVGALFILGHDASHGALFASTRANEAAARLLMLPSLHVQAAWVLGHNRVHHGFTAREGTDFVWHPVAPDTYRALTRLARLRHRVEWSWAGAGLYYLREVWWNRMVTFRSPAKHAAAIRRDARLTLSVFLLASTAAVGLGLMRTGGATGAVLMWAKLVGGPFVVFVQLIGWTVYVHHVGPDIRWWTAEAWTPWRAQLQSTTVLRAPRLLNVVFHNIFIHVPHHVDTRIPWYRLPAAAAAIEAACPDVVVDEPLRAGAYLRATRACKLYDFEQQRWLTYRQAALAS